MEEGNVGEDMVLGGPGKIGRVGEGGGGGHLLVRKTELELERTRWRGGEVGRWTGG